MALPTRSGRWKMAWQRHFHLYSNPHQPSTPRAIEAASTASQTQIWERAGKDGLALQPLPPLPYTNDSYP
ncbi:hypothetical protein EJ02DRAFT_458669 [Clathrospora elynae]|uniref:Uncharacterized protein n=1 Tax=Clathrospora elynae TaxID=706981 RepID=A0A6A5SGC2_9PLEO|nr:hypothetical protein EJ02DRAFT_458669 [Clathrospora elynae]